jgi:uncharacterized protein (DUF2252 family)
MAASFAVASRNNGFAKAYARAATRASVAAYREAMAGFTQMGTMGIWYAQLDEDQVMAAVHRLPAQTLKPNKATLQDDRRQLLERFQVVDTARKVVGVGSVGTWAFIVLLQGRDQADPLFCR